MARWKSDGNRKGTFTGDSTPSLRPAVSSRLHIQKRERERERERVREREQERARESKSRINHRKLSTPGLIRVTVFDAAYLIITDKMNHFHELVQCIEVYVSYRDVSKKLLPPRSSLCYRSEKTTNMADIL